MSADGHSGMRSPQLNVNGELTHLLTLEGLPAEVIRPALETGRTVRCPLRTIRRRHRSVNQLLTKTADF